MVVGVAAVTMMILGAFVGAFVVARLMSLLFLVVRYYPDFCAQRSMRVDMLRTRHSRTMFVHSVLLVHPSGAMWSTGERPEQVSTSVTPVPPMPVDDALCCVT